jgi:hypothetical protein
MNDQEFAAKHEVSILDIENEETGGIVGFIIRIWTILNALVERINAAKESSKGGVKLAVATVQKDAETVEQAETLATSIRELLFSSIELNENLAVLLPDLLSEIRGEVADVRGLVMQGLDLPIEEDEDSADVSELKAEAKIAKAMIEKFSTLLGMYGATISDLPANMVKKNKAGETVLKLPQIREPQENGENKPGRALSTSKWTFTLNGEKLPTVSVDSLAIRYLSTHTVRLNGSDLRDYYKNRTGLDFPAPPPTGTVTIPVPKGELVGTFNTDK